MRKAGYMLSSMLLALLLCAAPAAAQETMEQPQTEAQTEMQSEVKQTETEKQTEKQTGKQTEKQTESKPKDVFAKYRPGKVAYVKAAKVGETSFTLKWTQVKDANGYWVFKVQQGGNRLVKDVAGRTKTSLEIKNLKPGYNYYYIVYAYRTVKGQKYRSAQKSQMVKVSPEVMEVPAPTEIDIKSEAIGCLTLSWTKRTNATGYKIASYDKKTKKYTTVAVIKDNATTTRTFKNLKEGEAKTYVVMCYRKVGSRIKVGPYSFKVTGKPRTVADEAKNVRSFYYKMSTNKSVTVYNYETEKDQKLSKGTAVVAYKRNTSAKYIDAYLKNGDKIKIRSSALNSPSSIDYDPNSDYSTEVKEYFINSKGLSSATNYLVWINHHHAMVNIFKGSKGHWKLIKCFRVAIGKVGSMRGEHRICKKERYFYSNLPMVYWTYSEKYGGNGFHALVGARPGQAVSHGCIRCRESDLWYLYNDIPMNTRVYSY